MRNSGQFVLPGKLFKMGTRFLDMRMYISKLSLEWRAISLGVEELVGAP